MVRRSAFIIVTLLFVALLGLTTLSFRHAVFIPFAVMVGPDSAVLEWDFGEDLADPDAYITRNGFALLAHDGRLTFKAVYMTDDPIVESEGRFVGFGWARLDRGSYGDSASGAWYDPRTTAWQEQVSLSLPPGLAVIVAGAWPALIVLGCLRRRRRRQRGLCIDCAYDLRGSTAVCPECGAGVTAHPAGDTATLP